MVVVTARDDECLGKGQDGCDAGFVQFAVLPDELMAVCFFLLNVGALQYDIIASREDLPSLVRIKRQRPRLQRMRVHLGNTQLCINVPDRGRTLAETHPPIGKRHAHDIRAGRVPRER